MVDRYTNVSLYYHRLAFRGIENGKRVKRIVDYSPSVFTPSSNNRPTKWKTFVPPKQKGVPSDTIYVERIKSANIKEAREFRRNYKDVKGFELFGSTRYNYTYIADNYKDTSLFDDTGFCIAYLDIEVGSESGFPQPSEASEPITAITIYLSDKEKYFTFGCGEYKPHRNDIKYCKCEDESELLLKFIEFWKKASPDIVTGWNTSFFDIPYLYNRIHKINGKEQADLLSPWGMVSRRSIRLKDKNYEVFDVVGLDSLDYLDLYRNYSEGGDLVNYKLNTVAVHELKEKKIDYSLYSSLNKLYLHDYQKFIEYNIQDVSLVKKLEDKLQLIKMAVKIAYTSKVNFQDVFSQVRMWDMIIFAHFLENNLVVPLIERDDNAEDFEGAFVKQPVPGLYNWVVSYDVDSLYPNIIQQFNISPDTIIEHDGRWKDFSIENVKEEKIDTNFLKENNMTVAGNGHLFTTSKEGFLPAIIGPMYKKRNSVKKEMLEKQKQLMIIEEEIKKRGLNV